MDVFGIGTALEGRFFADMASPEHIRYRTSIKTDPDISPGILRFRPVEYKSAGSDQEILIFIKDVMRFVIIKMSLSVKYEVEDIIITDNGTVRLFRIQDEVLPNLYGVS